MKSVPPRGSGWVLNERRAEGTHSPPRGGTDLIASVKELDLTEKH